VSSGDGATLVIPDGDDKNGREALRAQFFKVGEPHKHLAITDDAVNRAAALRDSAMPLHITWRPSGK